ncbi:hypothetical protein V8E54_006138 [Elaphomyces granulatus]
MYSLVRYAYRKFTEKSNSPQGQQLQKTKPLCRHQLRPDQEAAAKNAPAAERAALQQPDQLVISPAAEPKTTAVPQTEPMVATQPCAICKQQKHNARVYRWKLILGLAMPFWLTSLDLTVVATALPFIASHFDKLNQLNWIVTAYTLTSTAFIPTFGQLSDVFGRHVVLQVSILFMLVGSTLCAAAQTWGMLLLGRALQGTSTAGISTITLVILADKVSLKDNAKNNTIFVMVSGIGYSVGPVIGGYLTNSNWRYCFVISIPVGFFSFFITIPCWRFGVLVYEQSSDIDMLATQIAFVSHFIIFFLLRNELLEGTYFRKGARRSAILPALATVDIFGTILFIFGVGLIILATAWGGSTYPWTSAHVLAPLIIGAVCFISFFVYEYFLEPGRLFSRIFPSHVAMLPYSFFSRWDTLNLAILQFAAGAGIYFTLVEDYLPSKAGVQLLYYIPGLGGGVYTAMFFCNVWPAQTFLPLTLGSVEETVGFAVLTWAVSTRNVHVVNGMMVLAGAGTGSRLMPSALHMAGVWPEHIAPAMSLMRFALPFGGTLGLSIMGSVFNNKFAVVTDQLQANGLQNAGYNSHDTNSLNAITDLPQAVQDIVRAAAKDAVMWAFISIMPILGISLFTSFFLGNVWIKRKKGKAEPGDGHKQPKSSEHQENPLHSEKNENGLNNDDDEDDEAPNESDVIYVPYLYALFKGNLDSYKHTSKPLSQKAKERQAQALRDELELRQRPKARPDKNGGGEV